jgi:hypothetical protein
MDDMDRSRSMAPHQRDVVRAILLGLACLIAIAACQDQGTPPPAEGQTMPTTVSARPTQTF